MYVLFVGAHPDDCDFSCGGTAALCARRGDRVKFVSVTNGDRGHMAPEYVADRSLLAARRLVEGRQAADAIGVEFESLGVHDGAVYVTEDLTERMVRLLRSWGEPGVGPDLVLVNRPNDYHRDHRYTAQLVLDATYMLTVPLMCSETPHLGRMSVFAYWFDRFREGGEFRPDVVVDVGPVMEAKVALGMAHASQTFEWLPFNAGTLAAVPADPAGRLAFVRERMEARARRVASGCRELAPGRVPAGLEFAEAFQISEYGRQPAPEELTRLFPADPGCTGGAQVP
ncbi:MAG: PIG-L family deacetylase [Armatimonadetes bacterium]|nr:PIG-L family deacetylase [Armatimonadota bacterium]